MNSLAHPFFLYGIAKMSHTEKLYRTEVLITFYIDDATLNLKEHVIQLD